MKLFFSLACALVMVGCSQSAPDTQSGSGNSTAASSATTAGGTPATPGTTAGTPASSSDAGTTSSAPPAIDATDPQERKPKDGDEVAVMNTSLGQIVLMFFPDKAPNHVDNFKKLAKKGFYDGIKFHRVIPGFMIQGGDPNTKKGDPSTWGGGGPGYTINAEFNEVKHERGILSMARTNDPNSAGSQFFIMVAANPGLDGKYSAFGKVVSGMDVVDKIVSVPTGDQNRPVDPPVIKSVKIVKWPVK